jgi:hypothetical protein
VFDTTAIDGGPAVGVQDGMGHSWLDWMSMSIKEPLAVNPSLTPLSYTNLAIM